MKKILHVYSGGLDSTILLQKLFSEGNQVQAINFHYGSNHNTMERKAARIIAEELDVHLELVSLDFIPKHFKSSLLSGGAAVPSGHYQAESMRSTVVPFRNSIMLSIAAGIAESNGFEAVSAAVHAGDHYIYPDCRQTFIDPFTIAMLEGTEKHIELLTPFLNMTKTDLVRIGKTIAAPMHISYSCYRGGPIHCGTCGACNERKEAFKDAGVPDLTKYEV